jgi:hypothetical protein
MALVRSPRARSLSDRGPPLGVAWKRLLVDNSLRRSLKKEELANLQAGKQAIYLDVLIVYNDVFKATRHTEIHFYRNGIENKDSISNTGESEPFN